MSSKKFEKIVKKFAREVRALEAGVSSHTLANHERSEDMLEDLKNRGLLAPEYEARAKTVKLQTRVPIEYRDIVLEESKKRGISQSEFVRMAIKGMVDKDVAASLPEVTLGRPRD